MKFNKFVRALDKNNDYFQEWVKDSDEDIYYFWKNAERGYKIHQGNSLVENISDSEKYSYHPFNDDILKEELSLTLSKRINELNDIADCESIFGKWLLDDKNSNRYYYWKGNNKGYAVIIEQKNGMLPRVVEVEVLDGKHPDPRVMKEFRDYKIRRALNNKLNDIIQENMQAKKNVFGCWMEDNDKYYYWKNESEGYLALVEGENLPEIVKFQVVNNEYFEPRNLEQIKNVNVKKVLDKKIKVGEKR